MHIAREREREEEREKERRDLAAAKKREREEREKSREREGGEARGERERDAWRDRNITDVHHRSSHFFLQMFIWSYTHTHIFSSGAVNILI